MFRSITWGAFVFAASLSLNAAAAQAGLAPITEQTLLSPPKPENHYQQDNALWIGKTDSFVAVETEGNRTFIDSVNAETNARHRLVEGDTPIPSPDGKYISYVVTSPDHIATLWICDSAGTNAHKVADLGNIEDGLQIAWSFDSSKLAFMTFKYINPNLATPVPGASTVKVYGGKEAVNLSTATIGIVSREGGAPKKLVLSQKYLPHEIACSTQE